MTTTSEDREKIEAALLASSNISRIIHLTIGEAGGEALVAAKVDLAPDLTMREVSVVLLQAKHRVQTAVPSASIVYLEPDVYIDPDAATPSTSSIVLLSSD